MTRVSRRRWPTASLTVCSAVALATGCGEAHRAAPKLPGALANRFAAQAAAIAADYEAGDACGAQRAAVALRRAITNAINRDRVPPALQEPLSSGVNDLVSSSSCTPPPPEPPAAAPAPVGRGKGKGHEKKDHGKKPKHDGKEEDE